MTRNLLLSLVFSVALVPAASAGSLNDEACVPAPEHPRPVVLVHGRGGTVEGLGALAELLSDRGYCVWGTNYGATDGVGPYGHDHLTVSGAQIAEFIDHVLATTRSEQVDVIGHSAGTGVLNNVILEKGRGAMIHRFVSFGGLHHPYAHLGASETADGILFLPNLIAAARVVDPDITAQEVIVAAIELYAAAGGNLAGIDVETATSNFAADLFEPDYWNALHGGLSEPPGTLVKLGNSARTLTTGDSIPSICYTNIVGIADLIAGSAAGFQDPAPNVDNFLLDTPSDHVQMLLDPVAVERMLDALGAACEPPPGDDGDDDGPGPDDDGGEGGFHAGCATSSPGPAALLLVALVLGLRRRGAR